MNTSFYDILGIDPTLADRVTPAAALWPNSIASLTKGINTADDSHTIVLLLQSGLTFANVRPGVDPHAALGTGAPGQIAFAADLAVGAGATVQSFYLRAMPDLGIQLIATDALHPAQVFFARDGRGHELIVDRLPVRLFLKEGLASPLQGASGVTVGTFDSTKVDSYSYTLIDNLHPTEVDCFVRLHLTTEGDIILEPAVPIWFGPLQWMGLPARAVYDVQLIPSPNRRDYLEWTHNDIGSFFSKPPAPGAIGFRSIELDFSKKPLSDLASRVQTGAVHIDDLELVLEDVVIPLTVPVLPIPSHGLFGFRRKITDPRDIAQAYSLTGAPVQVPIYGSMRAGGNGGTSLTLEVEKFFFRTGDIHAVDPGDQPQVQLQAGLIFQTTSGAMLGPTISIDDEWTLAAGMVMDLHTTPLKFTIADTTVGLVGFKFGVSIGRLASGRPFSESFELVGDLFITALPTGSDTAVFKMRSLTGKSLSLVLHDIGYKLGHPSLEGLQMPDGMQLIFANTVSIILEEMGWVEEPNGTPYFSFSGGVAIGAGGGNSTSPSGSASDSSGNGFGIRVRRLRFRLNDDASQPFFKIDGAFLKLKYSTVDIEGFGYISDYTDSGWAVKEWGFGAKVVLNAVAMTFSIAAEFIKGSRKNLADPTLQFDYFLAALELGFLPAGPIGLYDIRALVADNMAPNLDATFPTGESMALLAWHQHHDNALTIPANRSLADWIAENHALALGVGCGFSLNGCGSAMHLDIFIFFAKSQADTGLLVVGDLFLLKNPKPIAFVAIEYDIDKEKFGVMVGVDLTLADFASGAAPDWVAHIARLTGTLYFGNQPWSFAIGQLADQSTWLALKLEWSYWLEVKVMIGVCVQIVDGGPKGFGVAFTLSAGADWGIGGFVLWGSFGLIIGTWKTGSDSSGILFWIEAGFKINLFWVFTFGAHVGLRITYLGKHPWYVTLHGEVGIDTPWFLPSVTFTIDRTYQEPMPFDTATATQCLQAASAVDPTAQSAQGLLTPGLAAALGDASFVYSFNQLNGLTGIRIADPHTRDDIPVVSVDSTIAIDMCQPVSNDSLVATSTYDGTTDTGVQTVQDITLRYGLVSIAVRRSPRFGPAAGTWTDFVTDSQTQFSIGGTAPESLTFAWDVDSRADGKMAPKRLLMNSSAPYSFTMQSPQSDEEAAKNDPGFPCCDEGKLRRSFPSAHVIEFNEARLGSRVPRTRRFSGNGGLWNWSLPLAPTVCSGNPAYPGDQVAGFVPSGPQLVGSVDLLDPAAVADVELCWGALPGTLFFEGYDGATLAAQQVVDLRAAGQTTLQLAMASATSASLRRLLLRVEIGSDPINAPGTALVAMSFASEVQRTGFAGVGVARIAYVGLADAQRYVAGAHTCRNGRLVGPPGSDASGKLAFLPNHDYEVVLTSNVDVSTKDQGKRTLQLAEALYFRTKGLPGLNACVNVGDDIRRHVDSTYPMRRAIPLYRQEPCVLAFENSLSSVLPIDRAPAAGDPPEKAQMFPLELNIDRVASQSGLRRLTVPDNDWIAAHRMNPYPPFYYVARSGFAGTSVRRARSKDPLVLRHEAAKLAVPGCGAPSTDHASQVLLHEPVGADGSAGRWEPATGYRATVRQQGGPFTERSGFDVYDLGAFINEADGGATATLWSVDGRGNLTPPAAGGGRHYAACGELGWDHLQVHSHIDLATANAAGIAVGVGDGSPVPQAILATVEPDGSAHALVVRRRDASGENELGRAPVMLSGPFLLTVIAYDDVVRAFVGDVSVVGQRGAVREGRVALVGDGAATFAGIEVAALDMYSFEFVTSKYASFNEHLGSYDGSLPVLAAGALGGTAATAAAVLAGHGAEITATMTADADPQQRQRLFDSMISELGFGLHKDVTAVTITRLMDANGTCGLLLESPEPLSVTRDVSLTMTHHVRVWVPAHSPPRPPFPLPYVVEAVAPDGPIIGLGPVEATAAMALRAPAGVAAVAAPQPLTELTFGTLSVTLREGGPGFAADDRVIRVVSRDGGTALEVFDAPVVEAGSGDLRGGLRGTFTPEQAAKMPELAGVARMAPGIIAAIDASGRLGSMLFGHWQDEEVAVPLVTLTNGAETTVLILSQGGTPIGAGSYTLKATLDRDRWAASTEADPEQHYHDERSLDLSW